MLNPRFNNFLTNGFGNDKMFLPEFSMMMSYKNQIPDSMFKIYDEFWNLFIVLKIHTVSGGISWHTPNVTFFEYSMNTS